MVYIWSKYYPDYTERLSQMASWYRIAGDDYGTDHNGIAWKLI